MKKITALLLAMAMVLALCGCGKEVPEENTDTQPVASSTTVPTQPEPFDFGSENYTTGLFFPS